MQDMAQTADHSFPAQRCSPVHGHGRDGGGCAHRRRRADTVIHMEVGQPAAPAPTTAIAAARDALPRGASAIPKRSASPPLRARIARHYREIYGMEIDPATRCCHHRLIGCIHSGVSCAVRARRSRRGGAARVIRLTGTFSARSGCKPVMIETTQATRWAITPDMLHCGASQGAAQRRADRKPRQPDRDNGDCRGPARSHRRRRRRGDPFHLRRDLSRARLCICGRDGRETFRQRCGHQLVLEISFA